MENLFDLPHLKSLEITGPDAPAFADAQFTVALSGLAGDRMHPAAWCEPGGRAIAVLLAARHAGRVQLVLPAVQAGDIAARLERFTIGRKVSIGPPAPVAGGTSSGGGAMPLAPDSERVLAPGAHGLEDPDGVSGWRLADLRLGLAWLEPETSGQFLPQMLGLEDLDGLNYRKGCYPGQEVIARVHYRGRVTRRLSGFVLDGGDGPNAGLKAGQSMQLESGAATVIQALRHGATVIGLAVVPAAAESGSEVRLEGQIDGHSGGHSGRLIDAAALC